MNYIIIYRIKKLIIAQALSNLSALAQTRFGSTDIIDDILQNKGNLKVVSMKEATGKLTYGPKSRTGILYIPSDLMVDSAFPFQVPANLKVKIEGERLVIEKVE